MALKPYRVEINNGAAQDVNYFMNTTGEAGFLVVYDTSVSGTGSAFDSTGQLVKLPANSCGSGEKPAGVLLMDVVSKDLSQTHLNQYKREGQVGGKVTLLNKGTITTNALSGLVTNPSGGDAAYFTAGGYFTTVNSAIAGVSTRVGTFVSSKSSDGYVRINLTII